MSALPPAVHRTILCVDVERFTDRHRPHQLAVRDGVYRSLRAAFTRSGVPWRDCYHEDRGDGVFVLVPSEVPKTLLVTKVLGELALALADHNEGCDRQARIRLRLALHAGEVCHDAHGVAGSAIDLAFRLLDAEPLRRALVGSAGTLAVIASQWFYDEVVRHDADARPATYRRVRISVKQTRTSAWICLPDDPYPPRQPMPDVAVPRQLPAAIAGFTGRRAELRALTAMLEETSTVLISAIGGTAGIGKTALAVHWAHQVAARFPDGQLYVNLRGFDPAGPPVASAEAIRVFLDAFQVPPEQIPVNLEAQAALYRSLLAGRRILVVLDNARDIDQINPLLPGSPGCVVMVTSRNRLPSLIAQGARPLTLDVLPRADAHQLLARRVGTEQVTTHPKATEEIINRCARLPLALSIVAARAATHPSFPLTALADELRDVHQRLETLDSGEAATDTRTVFSWSYDQLTPEAARLFRLLGLHPGPEVSVPAAASLAGAQARSLLSELARAHLLAESAPGRFAFHDLLRLYANEQAHTHDPEPERRAAVHRMLDHYLHSAHAATLLMYPGVPHITLTPPQPGVVPEKPPDHTAARTWFDAEYPVLLAAIEQAAADGHTVHAWQIPWALRIYFRLKEHWHDWIASHHTALTATHHHDPYGQAHTRLGVGHACALLGRYDEAQFHLRQALALFDDLDDANGQVEAHHKLGILAEFQDSYEEAMAHTRQALALSRATGHRHGQAGTLNNLGWFHVLLGEPHQALNYCRQALTLQRELGDRQGEANTLDSIGYAHHLLGHHQEAITCLERAAALQRELGDLHRQATKLDHLGDAHQAGGDHAAARTAWQQAIDMLDLLQLVPRLGTGYADPDAIRAKLRDLQP
ncbi:tetratricopeptide repeat protein [Actinomadura fulvescens]|uniref:Tetratricopeptide repeat protein n=1 Tax=Actinomadura fulvescens TaxID=46160 RepID=A0ABN3PIR5_9ACTN